MKPNTQVSIIGSILLTFAIAHISALGQSPPTPGPEHEALKKLSPVPRLVQVSEIVDALFYLQSAPMVNGENIRIDGGSHAGAKW